MDLTEELTEMLLTCGADIAGCADITSVQAEVRRNLPVGVSVAVALNPKIIAGIQSGPNAAYFQEYHRVNMLLDDIGAKAERFLKEKGFLAFHLAATNTGINWETLSVTLPHKTIATHAGLGWVGKCALVVTREFGSALRFTTVLTNAPLRVNEPEISSHCGTCNMCVDACPGTAVTGENWQPGIPRETIYDAYACIRTAQEFAKKDSGLDENVCGVCIAACPWTHQYIKRCSNV